MKDIYEKIADRILPKFNEICRLNECKHLKCKCGHCSRNYHIGKFGECTKLNFDLTMCGCKQFIKL